MFSPEDWIPSIPENITKSRLELSLISYPCDRKKRLTKLSMKLAVADGIEPGEGLLAE